MRKEEEKDSCFWHTDCGSLYNTLCRCFESLIVSHPIHLLGLRLASNLASWRTKTYLCPSPKSAELKSLIDSHLRSQNIYGQIRDFVRQATKADDPSADDDSNKGVVLDALREKGVIEEVIKSIKRPRNLATPSSLIASTKTRGTPSRPIGRLNANTFPLQAFLTPAHLMADGLS